MSDPTEFVIGYAFDVVESRAIRGEPMLGAEAFLSDVHKSTSRGNPNALRNWYNSGAGGRIHWGQAGDFMQCVRIASQYMTESDAKGF